MSRTKVRIFSSVGGSGSPSFWTAWINELRKAGLDVEKKYAISSQVYRSSHSLVSKLVLRLMMYVGIVFQLIVFGILVPKGSVLIVTTNPFYAPWILATFATRRCKVVNLLYDLYPDALVAAGATGAQSMISHLLSKFTGSAVKKSDATVFLGRRIEAYVTSKYGEPKVSKVIPVGADCRCFPEAPGKDLGYPIEFLYCGNLGQLHETKTILSGLLEMEPLYKDAFHFHFQASGSHIDSFIESVRKHNLSNYFTFGGSLDGDAWVETMARAPVGLVLLKASARYAAVPSKVYSAMAAGQAVLAICPRKSDLADIVIDNDCGWVIEPGDAGALRETLEEIAQSPEIVNRRRQKAYEAARRHFCMPIVAQKWVDLIHKL